MKSNKKCPPWTDISKGNSPLTSSVDKQSKKANKLNLSGKIPKKTKLQKKANRNLIFVSKWILNYPKTERLRDLAKKIQTI